MRFVGMIIGGALAILSCSCSDEPFEFDLNEIPTAIHGWTISHGRGLVVSYSSKEGVHRVDDEVIFEKSFLPTRIVHKAQRSGAEYYLVRLLLPADYPAADFAEICRETRKLSEGKCGFELWVRMEGSKDLNKRSTEDKKIRPSSFHFGAVISSASELNSEKEFDLLPLNIGSDEFQLQGKRRRSISSLHDDLITFIESANLTDSIPVLGISFEHGVTLQRFVSSLDGYELQYATAKILFSAPGNL